MIYEYQKGRDHQKPLEFYRDYKGILVTDGLQQYHLVDKKLPDVTNANCWAHARRDFADAVKAMDKKDPSAGHSSVAYTALQKIGGFYTADTELKSSHLNNVFKNGRRSSSRWLRISLRG